MHLSMYQFWFPRTVYFCAALFVLICSPAECDEADKIRSLTKCPHFTILWKLTHSSERIFFSFSSSPISKITRLFVRETACQLMKTLIVCKVINGHPLSVRTPKLWWDATLLTLMVNILHSQCSSLWLCYESPSILHRLWSSSQRCLSTTRCLICLWWYESCHFSPNFLKILPLLIWMSLMSETNHLVGQCSWTQYKHEVLH